MDFARILQATSRATTPPAILNQEIPRIPVPLPVAGPPAAPTAPERPQVVVPRDLPSPEQIRQALTALHPDMTRVHLDAFIERALQAPWLEHAQLRGHNPLLCTCVSCKNWRGVRAPLKEKHSRMRSFWMRDEMYLRLQRIGTLQKRPLAQVVRDAFRRYLREVEPEYPILQGDMLHEVEVMEE